MAMASIGGRDGRILRGGPTNLDLDCKVALQRLLKPCNYAVIGPWLAAARIDAKRDIVKLSQTLAATEAEMADQRTGFAAASEPLLVNRNGRVRLAKSVPCTADRAQNDLLRNRHGTDQRDVALHAKRKFFFNDFAPVPSTGSIADFHRLSDVSLATDATTRVLTEEARRRLQLWQIRGPERDRQAAAQVMRSLRTVSEAVAALPTYSEHSRSRVPGSVACTDSMYEYARLAPKGGKGFRSGSVPHQLQPVRSAPLLLPEPVEPLISTDEIENVTKPGGDVVGLFDVTSLQTMKNKERGSRSKIAIAGGKRDWTTTYGCMAAV
mmetsp:Transcript_87158/g.219453  ORF Transcript_87158/g.219453 Transcript_87158/m.219453 type:complete len:323 (-) Transcript_87158:67-1035(-)